MLVSSYVEMYFHVIYKLKRVPLWQHVRLFLVNNIAGGTRQTIVLLIMKESSMLLLVFKNIQRAHSKIHQIYRIRIKTERINRA